MKPYETVRIEPDPDWQRLAAVIRRERVTERPVYFELFSNIEPAVLGEPVGADGLEGPEACRKAMAHHVRHQYVMGYDYARWRTPTFAFQRAGRATGHTAEGDRDYVTGEASLISSRAEFEAYDWPDMDHVEYESLDWMAAHLPAGMAVEVMYSGVFENTSWITGFVPLCFMLLEDPELARDCFDAVGERLLAYFERACRHESVRFLCMGDDLGFKTQTMIRPEALRQFVFPWHRRIVEAAHANGVQTILHSCGNVAAVWEDILDCGWDAKHSFEDNVEPVWEARERVGDRIALLGGFDMNRLASTTPEEVRTHTRGLVARMTDAPGWALGTGNSVADYVPLENYLAMMDEGWAAWPGR
jgi:uroporphyrinogen decarboxylase